MDDPVRVTVETDDEERSMRCYDDEGSVGVDGATFRFDVTGLRGGPREDGEVNDDTTSADEERSDDTAGADEEASAGRARTGTGSDTATDPLHLAPLADVPERTTLRFEALAGRRGVEGIAQRQGDAVIAWENSCPHEPDVRLDKGMGAFVASGQLVCDNHGARFNCDDGFCTHGPCRGQSLRPIDVEVRGDEVFLTDDRFESCRRPGR
ncbi:Rieske (2Fe-2S) protein [Halomarina salina]|uniref:Rieske (2Fe-2S) protein n=1 Tax=Halomarina salina TaxID=1872699 RepID=A0ABD5RI72_9EURY|nr:Rieske 2Fe-2S domain-containing protein [Halomarina salina]